MAPRVQTRPLFIAAFFLLSPLSAMAGGGEVLTASFLSEPFRLSPGQVHKKFYGPLPMPKGHIALRSLNAELVDESGASVPLSEVYLHHWISAPAYVAEGVVEQGEKPLGASAEGEDGVSAVAAMDISAVAAAGKEDVMSTGGFCNSGGKLMPFFGVGAETRRTIMEFPAPFGVEIGNPKTIPVGKKLIWWSEIHAIDTRGALNPKACLECRCDVYNTTVTERGNPLPEGYIGGLLCCYEGSYCQVKDGYVGERKTYYLRYTVKWLPMSSCIVPAQVMIFDVTDCKIEYNVDSCQEESGRLGDCMDMKKLNIVFPHSGRLVYAVGHQHVGATGIALKRQNGELLCSSVPIYGVGSEAGDEAGYVTGMETCLFDSDYPRLSENESISISSSYSKLGGGHTGVMGFYYIAVAVDGDYSPDSECKQPQDLLVDALQQSLEEVRNDDIWRVSLWGGFGGFLIGMVSAGGVFCLAFILWRQEHSTMAYVSVASA